jgi:histidinol-phosphate aminotransferase
MGLLDYYRQFEDMDQSEVNRGLRARRAEEKRLALERVPVLDLSGTEWPESPNADVVSASVYQARGRLNGYPDRSATAVRRALAERHYIRGEQIVFGNGAGELIATAAFLLLGEGTELVSPWPSHALFPALAERHYIRGEQIVFGNGAGELIATAAFLLLGEGTELVSPWPSHALFPAVAARAGARMVEVELDAGGASPEAVLAAVNDRTRVVALCNPNDPTGAYLESARVADLAARLPEHVHLFLDEAYVHFQDAEDEDACLRLVELFSRLLVFRSFSKVYGLSGLRAGYVIGSPAAASFTASLGPLLGVNALSQAAVLQALKIGDRDLARRRALVIAQRARLYEGLDPLPVEVVPSQANFLWLRAEDMNGTELAVRLEQSRVRVAPGASLGDERWVRAAVRDEHATDRLLWALRETLGERRPVTAGAL